jgi:hypothetical protein
MLVLPWGESISALSRSIFSTIAVLLNDIRKPRIKEVFIFCPRSKARRNTAREVIKTWRNPPRKIVLLRVRSLFSENSRPIVKRRSTTPISANISTR